MFIKWPVTRRGGTPYAIMQFHTTAFDVQMTARETHILESNVSKPAARGPPLRTLNCPGGPRLGSQQLRCHRTSKEDMPCETIIQPSYRWEDWGLTWRETHTSPTAEERGRVSSTRYGGPFLTPWRRQESKTWWGC